VDVCFPPCYRPGAAPLPGPPLWRELLDGGPPSLGGEEGAAALSAARSAGRLIDRRGDPVVPTLMALAASGERVLVLVADVARRRPLLSRDVLCSHLGRSGLYLQAACAPRIADALAGPDVVMAGLDLALMRPELAAAFAHVVLVDPPLTSVQLGRLAAAAPEAWLHAAWGAPEARFAEQVAAEEFDLDAAMRRAWRALSAGSGRFDDELEQELIGGDTFLRSCGTAAAALRGLRDAGLLVAEGGGYHLERPQSKVDVTRTDTYEAWHTLFLTNDFLRTCLTAKL